MAFAFSITTNSDLSYDKIMEYLITNSITFSKDSSKGYISLEVHGNSNDYTYFQEQIKSGVLLAHLQEMI
jgi:hypothetical protein